MNEMFAECSNLKELNLSNFNTDKVYSMEYMFYGCSSLIQLNIDNFNFDNVIYFNPNILGNCIKLKTPEIFTKRLHKDDKKIEKKKNCICF